MSLQAAYTMNGFMDLWAIVRIDSWVDPGKGPYIAIATMVRPWLGKLLTRRPGIPKISASRPNKQVKIRRAEFPTLRFSGFETA